ncbi:EamA family transporter RarD [Gryllotalpicola protaetiae]|uniref:EamA family transporter RarD n=1 Tax=Gryllotalpicola protaetiae TaxID=2419771 RepID=A0A387BP85_9MICO|nr:EamA family transporter RarD [Gryllotalpicola protaetiae]AYG02939.1 EamA family transporter RarD [Gryllotalpicola protaetiae]
MAAREHNPVRSGLLLGAGAYLIWGLLPLYFLLLAPAGPFEIVAWRIIWSLGFCAIALTLTSGWRRLGELARRPRILFTLAGAGVLIFINWQTYVYATTSGQVVEAALGYFINPIVLVFLGVLVLRERLRPLQWAAVGVSIVAVVVLTVAYGAFPWIALTLAFSFGLYGFVKKRVGGEVDALSGLTIESAWLVPVAVAELVFVGSTSGVVFGTAGAGNTVLLVLAGVVTAVPLLLFASSARRLPLVYIGLLQYLTPIIQFVIGVAFEHERMEPARWVGFIVIWAALGLLTIDLLRASRTARAARASQGVVTRP